MNNGELSKTRSLQPIFDTRGRGLNPKLYTLSLPQKALQAIKLKSENHNIHGCVNILMERGWRDITANYIL